MEASAHQLAKSRDCKTDSCPNDASDAPDRGRYAGLCAYCRKQKGAAITEARLGAGGSRPATPRPQPTTESFEQKAKQLVGVGRTLDQAVATVKKAKAKVAPLEQQLLQAIAEWKRTCRELAGEEA